MTPYVVKIPFWVKKMYPKRIWSLPQNKSTVYLTFDDGPISEVTPWVLQQLECYDAKATFFCIGNNVEANSSIYQQIIDDGHSVGNHTHNHLNAFKTPLKTYLANILKADVALKKKSNVKQIRLFRPPYGKLPSRYAAYIRKMGYQIVMWEVLSADFDNSIDDKKCLENVLNNTRNGSIIVFHDSIKAYKKLRFVLPEILKILTEKGFVFKALH